MQDSNLPAYTTTYTLRLRLEPIESRHVHDLWRAWEIVRQRLADTDS